METSTKQLLQRSLRISLNKETRISFSKSNHSVHNEASTIFMIIEKFILVTILQILIYYTLAVILHFLKFPLTTHCPLATISLFSISMYLSLFCFVFIDSTYRTNHTVSVFLCLTNFTQHNILWSIHVVTNGQILFISTTE